MEGKGNDGKYILITPSIFPIVKTEIFIFNYFNMLRQKDGFSRKNLVKIYSIISGTYLLTI